MTVTITGYAMLHKKDEFNFGPYTSIWKLEQLGQRSSFYCPKQRHRTTSRVRVKNGTLYESKTTAEAGKTATADTGLHKNVTEYNSYYSHE